MQRSNGRLVVMAPHATRTGSTKVLLGLLPELHRSLGRGLAIELASGGPLAADLRAFGTPLQPGEVPAAVLVNSCLAAGHAWRWVGRVPIAVYLHEPGEVIDRMSEEALEVLVAASHVMCASDSVMADALVAGVAPQAASVLPPILSPSRRVTDPEVRAACDLAGVGAGEPLVIGCGEAGRRKGADLFVEIVRSVGKRVPGTRFAWAGRRVVPFSQQLDYDVSLLGLAPHLRWLGELEDVGPLMAAADVLVVPSRYDPQPLVTVEAAQADTPTVGFAVGGLAELARDGGALVAPFPDSEALAALVVRLLADPEERRRVAARARSRAERLQAPAVVVPRFVEVLRSLLDRE